MADPNASNRDRRTPQPDSADPPEIVEAELVEDDPPPRPASAPADDEQYRQYQQFLQFQRFQEWQRQQGADPAAGPAAPWPQAAPGKRPLWRRVLGLLRYKFVRRLLYLVLALLVAWYLVSSMLASFTGGGGGSSSAPGTGGSPQGAAPVTPQSPQATVRAVYLYVAHQPAQACALFTDQGKAAFAYVRGAADCTAAAQQAHAEVTTPASYGTPSIPPDAITEIRRPGHEQATVDSCALGVTGGPPLGQFGMRKQANGGWQIDQYDNQPCR